MDKMIDRIVSELIARNVIKPHEADNARVAIRQVVLMESK